MIQDIYPSRLKNEFIKDIKVSLEDTVLAFYNSGLMVKNTEDNVLIFPKVKELGMDSVAITDHGVMYISFFCKR